MQILRPSRDAPNVYAMDPSKLVAMQGTAYKKFRLAGLERPANLLNSLYVRTAESVYKIDCSDPARAAASGSGAQFMVHGESGEVVGMMDRRSMLRVNRDLVMRQGPGPRIALGRISEIVLVRNSILMSTRGIDAPLKQILLRLGVVTEIVADFKSARRN